MSGLKRCPYCGSHIVPFRNAEGKLMCPACQNTGRPQAQALAAPAYPAPQPYAQPAYPAYPAYSPVGFPPQGPARGNAPGAVASMVLGILSIVLYFVGPILGIIAIVFGVKAKRRVRESQGRLQGEGMATAGIITGSVGTAFVVIILAAVVFVLVNNLGKVGDMQTVEDKSTSLPAGMTYRYTFEVLVSSAHVHLTASSPTGVFSSVHLYASDLTGSPRASSFAGETGSGGSVTQDARLDQGDYTVLVTCGQSADCDMHLVLQMART